MKLKKTISFTTIRFLFVKKNCKYFIGYLCSDHKVKPLHTILPKASAHIKSYDGQTQWMYFLIEDDEKTIWENFSVDIKKEFDSEPVYNNKNF